MVYEQISPRTFKRTLGLPSASAYRRRHPNLKLGDDLLELSYSTPSLNITATCRLIRDEADSISRGDHQEFQPRLTKVDEEDSFMWAFNCLSPILGTIEISHTNGALIHLEEAQRRYQKQRQNSIRHWESTVEEQSDILGFARQCVRYSNRFPDLPYLRICWDSNPVKDFENLMPLKLWDAATRKWRHMNHVQFEKDNELYKLLPFHRVQHKDISEGEQE